MTSAEHKDHIATRVSNNNCSECRADTERQFVDVRPWRYAHVTEYLAYVRPLLSLIRSGDTSVDGRIWKRKFDKALQTRISQKVPSAGRKYCDSYLERFRQFKTLGRPVGTAYLRRFASRGASCLDS